MATSTLGSLILEMGMDLARLRKDAEDAKRTVQGTIRDMQSTVKAGLGALGISLSGAAFVGMVRGAIDAADQLGKLSEKSGIAVESLSGLKLAAELGDVDFQTLSKGLRAFNVSLVEAQNQSSKSSRLFKALGVDINAGPYQAFRQFADAIAQLPDGELKTAAAMEILKKAGAEWIPVLNQGSAGIDEAQRKAEALGIAVGPQFSKDAREFNDNMKLLGKSSTSLGMSIANSVMPALTEMTAQILKASERGEKWLQVWREIQKVAIATMAAIHSTPAIERKAEELFAAPARQTVTGKIRYPEMEGPKAPPGPDLEAIRAALAASEMEQKRFIAALQSLEKEYASLTAEGRVAVIQWETEKGSLRELTAAHKGQLLAKAAVIDAYRRDAEARRVVIDGVNAEVAAIERSREISYDLIIANKEQIEQMKFEASLVGVSILEQEKMNAVRQIELDLRRRIAALPRDDEGNMMPGAAEAISAMRAEAEEQKRLVTGWIAARQAAERDWLTGVKSGMHEYLDEITNSARMTHDLFVTAFRGVEDALMQFVKRGKLDLKSLGDELANQIIRMQIVRPLMGQISGGLSGLFAPTTATGYEGVGSAYVTPFATGTDYVPRDMLAYLHKGEAVVPASDNQGGAVTINQHNIVEARTDSASIYTMLRASKAAIIAEIEERRRR